ncbi:MAG TPA: hypothetical protein VJV79_20250 [Polyangiaceae bacterium]|nr:hypothetical protein [Polyangiaceae bacterium]
MRSARKCWPFGILGVGLLSAGLLLTYRAYAAAGACGNCKITRIGSTSTGYVIVTTSLNMAGPCANPNWMVFDPNSAKGKSLMSLASAAYLSGARIDMAGTNSCSSSATAGIVAENMDTLLLH